MQDPLNRPLISVVIPVYNHARYVRDALMSVVEQDWRPLEIILIDDGSSDESVQVVRDTVDGLTPDEDVQIHVSTRPNKGAHATLNEGLAAAKGTFVTILNSDDLFRPGRLRACADELIRRNAGLVFTQVDVIDDDGAALPPEHPFHAWYNPLIMDELDVWPNLSTLLLKANFGVTTGNLFFRKSFYETVGPFADYRYAHDHDFLLRASFHEEPVIIRERMYGYRVHGANTISENHQKTEDEQAALTQSYLRRTFEDTPPNPLAPTLARNAYALASFPWPTHLQRAIDGLGSDVPLRDVPATQLDETLTAFDKGTGGPTVTLVTHELSRTGAPTLLRDVASALHGHGVRTRIIALRDGPLAQDFRDMNAPVLTEGALANTLNKASGFSMSIAHDPRTPALVRRGVGLFGRILGAAGNRIRTLRFLLKADRKSTLLLNSFASWPIGFALLKQWRGPVFWYIHETYEPVLGLSSPRYLARFKALAARPNVHFIFGSDATRAKWAAQGHDGEVFYWSGFRHDEGLTKSHGPDAKYILSVQSSGPRKGTRVLIEAFAHARANGLIDKDVQLYIIGVHPPSKVPFSRDLLMRVMHDDVRGSVQLIPNVRADQLPAFYEAAQVYVQTSTMECLPLALLKAMTHGLPTVTTDADGCREAIIDGETGLLIPQSQPVLLAEAMGRLLGDPALAARLGAGARARFEDTFALERTAARLIERITHRGG